MSQSYYELFNAVGARFRDEGWYHLDIPKFFVTIPVLIEAGINEGNVLEVGQGAGYLGLEWLKATTDTTLVCLDIDSEMVKVAMRNSLEYKKTPNFIIGSVCAMPFADSSFDGVFSSASLHEWGDIVRAWREIKRVLKPDGSLFITDLRRDVSLMTKFALWFIAPSGIRPYYLQSLQASYTTQDVEQQLHEANFNAKVTKTWCGLTIEAI